MPPVQARRAFQLPVGPSWRFALYTPAGTVPRAALLHFPAWTEEMNKSRRAVQQATQAFQANGIAVLQLDLYGCGDSPGEFEEASWAQWLNDLRHGLQWLRAALPETPALGWGLRAGALLGSALDAELDGHLWWQPVLQGKQALQQFLRLRLAADMEASGAKSSMADWKARLAQGAAVEVAGYLLPGALAGGLEAAHLQAPSKPSLWLEARTQAEPALLPATQQQLARWQLHSEHLSAQALRDASPWAATELEDCPALTESSLSWLCQRFPRAAAP